MIKVDNFDLINRLLSYGSEDDFFYLEIIKRRKDNPTLLYFEGESNNITEQIINNTKSW